MGQNIYLDSGILVPILWDRDPDREAFCREVIKDLRGPVTTYSHNIIVPNLVLGEALGKYFKDVRMGKVSLSHEPEETDFIGNMNWIIEQVNPRFRSVPTKTYRIAKQLSNRDRELEFNDLYIASMALLDSESTHLLSMDSDLVDTKSVERMSVDMMNDGKRNHRLKTRNKFPK